MRISEDGWVGIWCMIFFLVLALFISAIVYGSAKFSQENYKICLQNCNQVYKDDYVITCISQCNNVLTGNNQTSVTSIKQDIDHGR